MEACTMKPEVKKKPKLPKPPPKPAERKRNVPESLEKPTPLLPPRPSDSELSQTQFRMKRAADNEGNGDLIQTESKEKPSETPVVPPRPTEKELNARYSQRRRVQAEDTQSSRENDQSEVTKDEADFKQSNPAVLPGIFRRSQKEKTPTFTAYVTHDFDKEEKTDDVPAKQAPGSKLGGLKGVMKGLQIKSSPKAGRDPSPDPSKEEAGLEKEQPAERNKPEKNAEPKQDIGGLIAGMFRKTPKEKSPSSALKDNKADSDAEDTEEEKTSEQSQEKGNFFSGILKKPNKATDETPAQDNLSVNSELSASSDSLSENNSNKDKGGIFSGMFKKSPKPTEAAPTDEDQQSLHDNLSGSNDNLSENSKEKGGFFSGILRKSPRIPGEGTPGQDKQSLQTDPADSNETPSENNTTKEKGNVFSGLFKKSPKLSEAPRLEEGAEPLHGELSASSDSLSENKEKGGLFGGLLRKTPKAPGEENLSAQKDLSASDDSLSEAASTKEKGGVFSGIFKKPIKLADGPTSEEEKKPLDDELSGSSEALSENNTKEKGGIFSGMFKKPPKPAEAAQPEEDESPDKELSKSNENLSENKQQEKGGGLFSGLRKKTPKASVEATESPDKEAQKELSASNEDLSEKNTTKEKNIFSNMFKKPQKPAEGAAADKEPEVNSEDQLSGSSENLSEATVPKEKKGGLAGIFKRSSSIDNLFDEEKGGLFSGLNKKTPKASGGDAAAEEKDDQKEPTASNDTENSNTKEKNIFSNMFKKPQKPAEGATADKELEVNSENQLSGSCENLSEATTRKEKKGGLGGIFKRSSSIDNLFDEEKGGLFSGLRKKPKASGDDAAGEDKDDQKELTASNDSLSENSNTKEKNIFSGMFKKQQKPAEGAAADEELNTDEDMKLSGSCENLLEVSKEKTGGLAGLFKKSPKAAPRSIATKDPLSDTKELYSSCDSLAEDDLGELSTSRDNLLEAENTPKEKKAGFAGIFKRTPKAVERQGSEDMEAPEGGGLRRRRTIKKKQRVVSFRVKKTLPRTPKLGVTFQNSESSENMPVIEEAVEMQELNPAQQESRVEVETVEMAAYPTEDNPAGSELESDELMDWWNTVKGWAEWNATSNFQEDEEEMVMEQAADRVYMAARLFVRLFNQRGASLQQRILELFALADAADQFHKRTVTAAVGGGVASVAGSVATITGLILAPFTFGASIIVTAVGIGVATAGSIASATANITDTVHSNMDRKKLEKMIQGYQEEIKVIRECLEFVQAGMDTLQEWDFEKYSESAAKKALNHNLKHVMKEGGRAGKALMINTDKLISTVQVLGAAGGAAKAVQAISVTTGVMSALFLALDVFFLAKDSHELRKGAKTKFATKIRDVCKELQDGLLELNKVKTQLQKTMDGIEVEEYEEYEEIEVEVEDDLESDPKKLAELEQELDLMEEKLDKKVEEEQKKIKETEKANMKSKKEEDAKKEGKKESKKGKGEEESKIELKLEKISDEEKEQKNEKDEVLKEQSQKGKKKDKETENRITAGKEKYESKKEDNGANKKTDGKEKEKIKSGSGESKREERGGKEYSERESERHKSSREDERAMNKEKEAESGSTRRHSSRSDKDRPHRSERESKHETKEEDKRGSSRHSDGTESRRRTEEERGVKDWRAEMKSREERRESRESKRETERGTTREDHGKSERKESHRSHESASRREHPERERRSSREEPSRSHHRERDEKRGGRIESARRQFERAGGEEEERGKRREEGESQRRDRERRGSDREHRHSRHGSRAQSIALLEDGLNI